MASLKNSKVQIPFNFGSFLRLRNRYGCCYIYKTEQIYNLCFCVRKLCKLLAFDSHGETEVVWSEFHLTSSGSGFPPIWNCIFMIYDIYFIWYTCYKWFGNIQFDSHGGSEVVWSEFHLPVARALFGNSWEKFGLVLKYVFSNMFACQIFASILKSYTGSL